MEHVPILQYYHTMKGTKVLTLGAVAMYTPVFSWFHRLRTYACMSSWVYIIIEYTHMRMDNAVQIRN